MFKNTLFSLLIGSLFLVVSCKKEDTTVTPTATVNTSYQPTTKGSTWKYKSTALSPNEYTITATGNTKTINNKVYQVFTNTASPNQENYLRLDGENAYTYGTQNTNGLVFTVELLDVKPAAAVGDTWEDKTTVNNQGFMYDIVYKKTMKGKGLTRKVNGKDYKDVIMIERVTSVVLQGTSTPFETETLYYAKGIGPIEQIGTAISSSLLDYTIK